MTPAGAGKRTSYQGIDAHFFASDKEQVLSPEQQAWQKIEQEKAQIEIEKNQIADSLVLLKQGFEEVKNAQQRWEEDIKMLALLLAECVIDNELTTNPNIVLETARRMLTETIDEQKRVLSLNPQDLEFVKSSRPDAWQGLTSCQGLELKSNETFPRGTLQLEAPTFQMEGSVSKRLALLWQEIVAKGVS